VSFLNELISRNGPKKEFLKKNEKKLVMKKKIPKLIKIKKVLNITQMMMEMRMWLKMKNPKIIWTKITWGKQL
jgi:hypothetical protein